MEPNLLRDLIDDEYRIIINDMGAAPVIAAMTEVMAIPQSVNKFMGSTDPRIKVNAGMAVKALIINILYGRSPLVHVSEFFEHLDCGVLFDDDIVASDLSDDRLGDVLEALGNCDTRELYSELCMYALKLHNCAAESIHVDTTNISVYGGYDTAAKDFEITYGDPKSKRKDLKQFNMGIFVQQNGFPIGGSALSGNNSDAVWFRDALDELNQIFSGDLNTMPVCIFDAAGSNNDMFDKANDLVMPTIIRMSDRFNTAGEHISRAWNEGRWSIVDKNGHTLEEPPVKDFYKLRSFDITMNGYDWRLVVAYSSELEKAKKASAARNHPKSKEKLEKSAAKLSKLSFETAEQAMVAGNAFAQENIGLKTPFKYEISVEKKEISKYKKRGRPSKTSEKTTAEKYFLNIVIGERDEDLYIEWLRQESCFVLVSNVPKERHTAEEIFKEYKEQWVVEDRFKFLKQPMLLGPIWLQKPERIKGLIFVLLLSLLVSMYMCYRCMITLQGEENVTQDTGKTTEDNHETENACDDLNNNNSICDQNEPVVEVLKDSPYATLKSAGRKQQLLTSDGRLVDRPTYKVIKKILDPIKTVIKRDSYGNVIRKFAYGTEMRRLDLVVKIGFDPTIYLEKFTLKMDLWEYT